MLAKRNMNSSQSRNPGETKVSVFTFGYFCKDAGISPRVPNLITASKECQKSETNGKSLFTRCNPWMFAYNACHPSHPGYQFSRYKRTVRVCSVLYCSSICSSPLGSSNLRQSLRCTARAMRSRIFWQELQLILLIGSDDPPWTITVAHEWWPHDCCWILHRSGVTQMDSSPCLNNWTSIQRWRLPFPSGWSLRLFRSV